MNYRPKCKMQNCKTSRIKHMRNLHEPWLRDYFLDTIPKE